MLVAVVVMLMDVVIIMYSPLLLLFSFCVAWYVVVNAGGELSSGGMFAVVMVMVEV